jgi:hypothetical protein
MQQHSVHVKVLQLLHQVGVELFLSQSGGVEGNVVVCERFQYVQEREFSLKVAGERLHHPCSIGAAFREIHREQDPFGGKHSTPP